MKKFIFILLTAFIAVTANAQNTYKSSSIKVFDRYDDLVSDRTISSLVTVETSSIIIDTKGLSKKVFYRIDEEPVSTKRTKESFILDRTQEYIIDVLPSTYRSMADKQKTDHLFLMSITDVYLCQDGTFMGSMIDIANSSGNTIRYIFE